MRPSIIIVVVGVFSLFSILSVSAQDEISDASPSHAKLDFQTPKSLFKLVGSTPASGSTTYLMTGFTPEVRFNKGQHIGASYSLMTLSSGFGLGIGGISLGVDGDAQNSIYECKLSLFVAVHLIATGGNFKLNFARKFYERDQRINSIRPELGLALGPIFLNYGYDIYLGKKPEALGRHNFSLTTYIPLFIIKEDRFGYLEYGVQQIDE